MPTAKPNAKPARAATTTAIAVHPGERPPVALKAEGANDETQGHQLVQGLSPGDRQCARRSP